ncbi:hypothetical protein Tco_1453954 [Tanacetum coccineum]
MENKQLFMSALSVGIGVGVGFGMGKTVSRWTGGDDSSSSSSGGSSGLTPQTMEREMLSMIVDGKDSKITFDEFPYYLRKYEDKVGCCATIRIRLTSKVTDSLSLHVAARSSLKP